MTGRRSPSAIDEREQTNSGRLGMAAATAAVDAVALINDALFTSGLKRAILADRLEVSAGRVSQIVNGDGNIRVSTLSRVLRALGYKLSMTAVPVDDEAKPIPAPRRRTGQKAAIDGRAVHILYTQVLCVTDEGVGSEPVFMASRVHPSNWLEAPSPLGNAQPGRAIRSSKPEFEPVFDGAHA